MKNIEDADYLVVIGNDNLAKVKRNDWWNRTKYSGRILGHGTLDHCDSFADGYNDPITSQTRIRRNGNKKADR